MQMQTTLTFTYYNFLFMYVSIFVSIFSIRLKEKFNQQLNEPTVNDKYNLSKWKYSQLRDIINTSCDIDLLEVSKYKKI